MKPLHLSVEVPCDDGWDVVVAGGGPSGCTAATAAARSGARTLLIEGTGCLGGMGTSGMVTCWCPFSDGEKLIYSGLAHEIFDRSKRDVPHVKSGEIHGHVPFDPEHLKTLYDDLVQRHGVTVLFNSMCCGVPAEDGRISAIIVGNKAGLTAYQASVFVDCTGDADVAAAAGAECQYGAVNGEVMPSSYCFTLTNVDSYAFTNGPSLYTGNAGSPIWEIFRSGKYPHIHDAAMCPTLVGPGCVSFNAGHQPNLDGTNVRAVSDALRRGRQTAREYRDALAEFYPGAFGAAHLTATANLLGVRESRRVVGDYVLSMDDFTARRSFADEICRNAYHLDLHGNREDEERTHEDWKARVSNILFYAPGESHGIPYRCLTPRGFDNLLVAGRPVSCERTVHSSIRVMPVCLSTGEAAGTAAALAAQMTEPDVHAVPVVQVRQTLREHGAYLP